MSKKKIIFIIIAILIVLLVVGYFVNNIISMRSQEKAKEIVKDYYRLKLLNRIEETKNIVTDNIYSSNNIYEDKSNGTVSKIAKTANDIFVEKDIYFEFIDLYKIKNTYIIKYKFTFPDYTKILYSNTKDYTLELNDNFKSNILEEIENGTIPKVTLIRESKIIKVDGKYKIDELGENLNEN